MCVALNACYVGVVMSGLAHFLVGSFIKNGTTEVTEYTEMEKRLVDLKVT